LSTKRFFLFGIIVWCFTNNTVFAQRSYQLGALPSLNTNYSLKNDWSLNGRLESRILFLTGRSDGLKNRDFNYQLTDFALLGAKKVGLKSRVAGGFLVRVEGNEIIFRLIQQYIIVRKMSGIRFAHRIMTDQTFSESEKPDFRLRYRLSTEFALDGESVDPGEFYIKVNNEYLNSMQDLAYDLEIRMVPLLGYSLNDRYKMEAGLDYRINSFIRGKTRHSYWMNFNFFIEI
jgi:hypothetical protein